jgi:hypothetical protein
MNQSFSLRFASLLAIAVLALIAFNRSGLVRQNDVPEPNFTPGQSNGISKLGPTTSFPLYSHGEGTTSIDSTKQVMPESWTEKTLSEHINEANNGALRAILLILNDHEVFRTNTAMKLRLAALTYRDMRSAVEVASKAREMLWSDEVALQVSSKKDWQDLPPLNENRNLSRYLGELRAARGFRDSALRRIQRMGVYLNDGEIFMLFKTEADQEIDLDRFPKVIGLE